MGRRSPGRRSGFKKHGRGRGISRKGRDKSGRDHHTMSEEGEDAAWEGRDDNGSMAGRR